jgi:hypothetical protein
VKQLLILFQFLLPLSSSAIAPSHLWPLFIIMGTMGIPRFLHIIRALVLLHVCSHTQAYSVNPSCKSYGDNNLDLTKWLRESMEEAKDLATLAKGRVTQPYEDDQDNSHDEIWHGETDGSKLSVAEGTHVTIHSSLHIVALTPIGYYQKVIDMPHWTYKESVGSLIIDRLTVECGGDSIVPDGDQWLDMTTLYKFTIGSQNAPKGPESHVCDGADGWTLLGKNDIENPLGVAGEDRIGIIILCKAAIERLYDYNIPVRSEHPQLEAASLAMVQRKGMLKEGEQVTVSLSHVWSSTLLHELFHYVLDEQSNYLPFIPLDWVNQLITAVFPTYTDADEVYDWIDCTDRDDFLQGFEDAVHNPDSFALFAVGKSLYLTKASELLLIRHGYSCRNRSSRSQPVRI